MTVWEFDLFYHQINQFCESYRTLKLLQRDPRVTIRAHSFTSMRRSSHEPLKLFVQTRSLGTRRFQISTTNHTISLSQQHDYSTCVSNSSWILYPKLDFGGIQLNLGYKIVVVSL